MSSRCFRKARPATGVELLPFHANLIQAAVSTDVPAQPVALQFVDTGTGARSLTPCYIGDDTLLGSVWRIVSGPPITAVVTFGAAQHAAGRDRRAWAADLRRPCRHCAPPEPAAPSGGPRETRACTAR